MCLWVAGGRSPPLRCPAPERTNRPPPERYAAASPKRVIGQNNTTPHWQAKAIPKDLNPTANPRLERLVVTTRPPFRSYCPLSRGHALAKAHAQNHSAVPIGPFPTLVPLPAHSGIPSLLSIPCFVTLCTPVPITLRSPLRSGASRQPQSHPH